MILHFFEVWGLLLAAFVLGGAIGTVLYMGLAVSPFADAQIGTADAIADRVDALRDLLGRRRDTGLYRHQREEPAYVMPLPIPDAPRYAGEHPETAEEEAMAPHWPEPEALVPAVEDEAPAAAVPEEYWEEDEWAAAEDDARWPEDHYWAEAESPAAVVKAGDQASETATGIQVEVPAAAGHPREPSQYADGTDDDERLADDTDLLEPEEISGDRGLPMPAAEEPDPLGGEQPTATLVAEAPADDGNVIAAEAVPEPAVGAALDTAPPEALAKAAPDAPESSSSSATAMADVAAAAGDGDAPEPFLPAVTPVVNVPESAPRPVAEPPALEGAAEGGRDVLPLQAAPAGSDVATPATVARGRIPPRRPAPPRADVAPDPALPSARPLALSGPRNGVPDNLQRIRGVGRKNEELLNSLGIYHFGQIAAWTPAEARWVASQLAFPERLERDDWLGQAMVFATGGDTGYVKAAERRRKGDDDSTVAA